MFAEKCFFTVVVQLVLLSCPSCPLGDDVWGAGVHTHGVGWVRESVTLWKVYFVIAALRGSLATTLTFWIPKGNRPSDCHDGEKTFLQSLLRITWKSQRMLEKIWMLWISQYSCASLFRWDRAFQTVLWYSFHVTSHSTWNRYCDNLTAKPLQKAFVCSLDSRAVHCNVQRKSSSLSCSCAGLTSCS